MATSNKHDDIIEVLHPISYSWRKFRAHPSRLGVVRQVPTRLLRKAGGDEILYRDEGVCILPFFWSAL